LAAGFVGRGEEAEGRGMKEIAKAEAHLPSLADALTVLARLELEVDRSETFLDLDRVANAAAGLQRMFKRTPELADRAGIVFTKAETKVGIAWEDMPKAKGGGQGANRYKSRAGSKKEPALDSPLLVATGVLHCLVPPADMLASSRRSETSDGLPPAAYCRFHSPSAQFHANRAVPAERAKYMRCAEFGSSAILCASSIAFLLNVFPALKDGDFCNQRRTFPPDT
jgi:hypothetical protein